MAEERFVKVGFGIMVMRDYKILLGRRNDDPKKADSELHGEGTWTMPGGKMRFGETFEEACARETEEETGIILDKENLTLISLTNDAVSDAHFLTVGFLAEKFSGEPKVMEPDEITEWRWFSFSSLPINIFPPSKKVVDNYLDGRIYNPRG